MRGNLWPSNFQGADRLVVGLLAIVTPYQIRYRHYVKLQLIIKEQILDAFSHQYRRICPSVHPSLRLLATHELKSWKSAVFGQNYQVVIVPNSGACAEMTGPSSSIITGPSCIDYVLSFMFRSIQIDSLHPLFLQSLLYLYHIVTIL